MLKAIKYTCEECSVSVQIVIYAPPRDVVALKQRITNFIQKCPRCGLDMQEYFPIGNGSWEKVENEQG